jgi:hypothetical protein
LPSIAVSLSVGGRASSSFPPTRAVLRAADSAIANRVVTDSICAGYSLQVSASRKALPEGALLRLSSRVYNTYLVALEPFTALLTRVSNLRAWRGLVSVARYLKSLALGELHSTPLLCVAASSARIERVDDYQNLKAPSLKLKCCHTLTEIIKASQLPMPAPVASQCIL